MITTLLQLQGQEWFILPFPCCCFGFGGILGLAALAFWIWMIIDCATNEPADATNNKLVWILIVILLNWIGALIYFLVRRPQRIKEIGH